MKDYLMDKALIIGPSPHTQRAGGVATHMRMLASLKTFRRADFVELGHTYGRISTSIPGILRNIIRLRRRIKSNAYDAILINTSIYDFSLIKVLLVLWVIPSTYRNAILVFFHGGLFQKTTLPNLAPALKLMRMGFSRVRRFYFLSRTQEQGFQERFPGLPTGSYLNYAKVDSLLDRKGGGEHVSLLFVGRVVRSKGVFDLLAAVEHLVQREGLSLNLTVVGDGEDLAELKRQAEQRLPGYVTFTGFVSGVALEEAYAQADILGLPTFHPEGLPFVVIEAMQAGLPIVATAEGALGRVVIDGETGFRIPPHSVEQLAKAIKQLYEAPALRSTIGDNNQRFFKENLSRSAAERFYSALMDEFG